MPHKTMQMLAFAALTFILSPEPRIHAGNNLNHEDGGKAVETGEFHGQVHKTSGRATIYEAKDGKLILRLTHFSTSERT